MGNPGGKVRLGAKDQSGPVSSKGGMEAGEGILADTANVRKSMVEHFGLQEGDKSHDSEDGLST